MHRDNRLEQLTGGLERYPRVRRAARRAGDGPTGQPGVARIDLPPPRPIGDRLQPREQGIELPGRARQIAVDHGLVGTSQCELLSYATAVFRRRRDLESRARGDWITRRIGMQAKLVLALEDLGALVGVELDVRSTGYCEGRAGG